MRRRLTALVLGISALGVLTALACGFPSVDFAADTDFQDGGFVGSEGGSSGGDTSTPDDGGNPDGNPCKGDPACDCDGDGDKNPSCGGGDCDDRDDRVRSTQTDFVKDPATPDAGGDWNCDGTVEREEDAGFFCANVLDGGPRSEQQVLEACNNARGFQDDPACGATGTFVVCERANIDDLKCRNKGDGEQRVRGCR